MEIGTGIYEATGSAAMIARQEEQKEGEQRQAQAAARDTVTISDEARERIQAGESGEAPDGDQQASQEEHRRNSPRDPRHT